MIGQFRAFGAAGCGYCGMQAADPVMDGWTGPDQKIMTVRPAVRKIARVKHGKAVHLDAIDGFPPCTAFGQITKDVDIKARRRQRAGLFHHARVLCDLMVVQADDDRPAGSSHFQEPVTCA